MKCHPFSFQILVDFCSCLSDLSSPYCQDKIFMKFDGQIKSNGFGFVWESTLLSFDRNTNRLEQQSLKYDFWDG